MQGGEKKSLLPRYEQHNAAAEANMWKTGLQLCERQQQGGTRLMGVEPAKVCDLCHWVTFDTKPLTSIREQIRSTLVGLGL